MLGVNRPSKMQVDFPLSENSRPKRFVGNFPPPKGGAGKKSAVCRRQKPKLCFGLPCGVRQKTKPAIGLPVLVPSAHEEVPPWVGKVLMSKCSIIVYSFSYEFFIWCALFLLVGEIRPQVLLAVAYLTLSLQAVLLKLFEAHDFHVLTEGIAA